jgi:hypothetical protein
MTERTRSLIGRFLLYAVYGLAALIGLAAFLALAIFIGFWLQLWPIPNDR